MSDDPLRAILREHQPDDTGYARCTCGYWWPGDTTQADHQADLLARAEPRCSDER